MQRIVFAVIALIMCAAMLAGCGAGITKVDGGGTSDKAAKSADAGITIDELVALIGGDAKEADALLTEHSSEHKDNDYRDVTIEGIAFNSLRFVDYDGTAIEILAYITFAPDTEGTLIAAAETLQKSLDGMMGEPVDTLSEQDDYFKYGATWEDSEHQVSVSVRQEEKYCRLMLQIDQSN